jgi:hypothetical protein
MGVEESDRKLYEQLLREIRLRVDFGIQNCQPPHTPLRLEAAALQLRKVLELIVFGSLVNNRQAIETISAAFAKKDADEARKLAKRSNPKYWPKGLTNKDEPEAIRPDQLAEDEWGRAYGFASELLHVPNPYSSPIDYFALAPQLQQWFKRIIALLNHHQVELVEENYLLRCLMMTSEGGDVQVAVFMKIDPAELAEPARRWGHTVIKNLKASHATFRVPNEQIPLAEWNVNKKRLARVSGDPPGSYYVALPDTKSDTSKR